MSKRWASISILTLTLALVAVACGDSGDPAEVFGQQTHPSDTAVDFGDIGTLPNIPGLSSECESLAEFIFGMTQAFVGGVDNAQALLDSASDNLPSSLQGELDVVANAAITYSDVLDELDIDLFNDPNSLANLTPDQQQAFGEAAEAISTPEVDAAFEVLSTYGEQECDTLGG